MADEQQTLPERPKEEEGPSKKALKKAAKEAEKAKKKAEAKAAQSQQSQQQQQPEEDVSKDDYGDLPVLPQEKPAGDTRRDDLSKVSSEGDIVFRAVVENARKQSAKLGFLNLRQGFSSIQAVIAASESLSRQMVKYAQNIPAQSVVLVHGLIKKAPEPINSATIKDFELHVKKLYTIARAETPLPIQVEDAEQPLPEEGQEEAQHEEGGRPVVSLATRLNNRTLDLRTAHNQAIFRIKDGVCDLFASYLRSCGFVGIQTPKLLGAASEGGSNVFEVTYFSGKAYLAQSPQLYKQMLVASRFERVFEIGPIFRAENSNTARHLTEFTGLDMEMAFEVDYHEVVEMLEGLMLHIFKGLKERYQKETDLVRNWLGTEKVEDFKLPEAGKVPRIPFAEGIKMLREDGVDINEYDDLSTPDEKHLGRLILQKYNTDFYVLDQFPLGIRPFYTMPSPANPEKLSNSYDFFMRGQEICSGAQRVHDAELLCKRMREFDPPLDPNSPGLKDYVEGFRHGCPPHGGGGFGLERIVMLWLGLPNVRLASLFPRDPGRIMP